MASLNGSSNSPPGPFIKTVSFSPGFTVTSFWTTRLHMAAVLSLNSQPSTDPALSGFNGFILLNDSVAHIACSSHFEPSRAPSANTPGFLFDGYLKIGLWYLNIGLKNSLVNLCANDAIVSFE